LFLNKPVGILSAASVTGLCFEDNRRQIPSCLRPCFSNYPQAGDVLFYQEPSLMLKVRTEDVRALYSKYPYPSPIVGTTLSYDIASLFSILCRGDELNQKKVLDAGCGTGQRMLGFAKRYPKAIFQGIDMTEASLEVAASLARKHGITNATFASANILELDLQERFDFIISTGVVHHLEDPPRGLRNLCRHLSGEGVICIWHYHPFGEFERLLGRELLLTLWGEERSNLARGRRIMEKLGLSLVPQQYGESATQGDSDLSPLSISADAFMHPIVNAYRFEEAMTMFRECAVDWVAINGINTKGSMKLVDLAQVEEYGRALCIQDPELFEEESLLSRYRALSKIDRLKIIELMTKPTGFTLLAGRKDSFRKLGKRIEGNLISIESLADAPSRLLRVD
jgi:SAM-dependent methyltransferase